MFPEPFVGTITCRAVRAAAANCWSSPVAGMPAPHGVSMPTGTAGVKGPDKQPSTHPPCPLYGLASLRCARREVGGVT
jgi:hypothetical protein